MKQRAFQRTIGFLAFVALLTPLAQASAGAAKNGIAGDWQVTVDFEGRKMTSILSLSQDKEGKLAGKWISFWGVTELRDLKYEGKQLSFLQVYQMGENETRLNFDGAYTGLNRPGRQPALSDDKPISTGITLVFVLGDIFDHFVFNGHSQHFLSPLSQDFRQNVPTFG
jgi:hypothetical protein